MPCRQKLHAGQLLPCTIRTYQGVGLRIRRNSRLATLLFGQSFRAAVSTVRRPTGYTTPGWPVFMYVLSPDGNNEWPQYTLESKSSVEDKVTCRPCRAIQPIVFCLPGVDAGSAVVVAVIAAAPSKPACQHASIGARRLGILCAVDSRRPGHHNKQGAKVKYRIPSTEYKMCPVFMSRSTPP